VFAAVALSKPSASRITAFKSAMSLSVDMESAIVVVLRGM
jgi:hypothetical protein